MSWFKKQAQYTYELKYYEGAKLGQNWYLLRGLPNPSNNYISIKIKGKKLTLWNVLHAKEELDRKWNIYKAVKEF